jgi:hypothetical protein
MEYFNHSQEGNAIAPLTMIKVCPLLFFDYGLPVDISAGVDGKQRGLRRPRAI